MAWERRGNHRYYYDARKVNGRVKKTYLGRGDQAIQLAALEEARRAEEKARKESWKQEAEQWEEAEAATKDLAELVKLLTHATLIACGYHQHHRGSWRKRRDVSSNKSDDGPGE